MRIKTRKRLLIGKKRIKWKPNLEHASWWGGYFEQLVGSVKRSLRKVLGNANLSFNALEFVLPEILSTLMSRPLAIDLDEVGKVPPVPSHLLHGRKLSCMPTGIEYGDDINQNRFQNVLVI